MISRTKTKCVCTAALSLAPTRFKHVTHLDSRMSSRGKVQSLQRQHTSDAPCRRRNRPPMARRGRVCLLGEMSASPRGWRDSRCLAPSVWVDRRLKSHFVSFSPPPRPAVFTHQTSRVCPARLRLCVSDNDRPPSVRRVSLCDAQLGQGTGPPEPRAPPLSGI